MDSRSTKWSQKLIQILPVIGLIAFVVILVYVRHSGITTAKDLQNFIKQFGNFAVVAFIIIQVIQPIIPFLPGGIATVVGMWMFGNLPGIIYSYIGLVIGEVLLFLLVRRFGRRFARFVLAPKNYQTFETGLVKHEKKIKRALIVCFVFPFLPDDIMCLVAGMTDLPLKNYLQIVLTFKLWSVASYGYLVVYLVHNAF